MFKTIVAITILECALSINSSLSDFGEVLYLGLDGEFRGQPNATDIQIDMENSRPSPITDYLNITLSDVMTDVTVIASTTVSGWQLSSGRIIKGVSIFSQPIRILLVEDNLVVLLFLEKSNQTLQDAKMQVINVTEKLGSSIQCGGLTVSPNSYTVFLKCEESEGEFAWIVRIQLETKAQTDTVSRMVYDTSVRVSMAGCRQRQLLYASSCSIAGQKLIDSLLMLCPVSERSESPAIPPLLSIKTSLQIKTIVRHSFENCPQQCCNSTQLLGITGNHTLIMITSRAVYTYTAEGCSSKPLMTIKEFREAKIGTSTWVDDLYVLTKNFLFIKYPKIANLKRLDVSEQNMDVTGFVVTKHYIYLQYKSHQAKLSRLRVYSLSDSMPYLVYRGPYSYSSNFLEVGNYLEDFDCFFSFEPSSNTLRLRYYSGRQVAIESRVSYSTFLPRRFSVVLNSSDLNVTIDISLRSFVSKSYTVDNSKLRFQFEEQFVAVPLHLPISGPLLTFYLYENNFSTFDYINGLNIVNLSSTFPNGSTLTNLVGFRFKTNLDEPYIQFFSRSNSNLDSILSYHICALQYKHGIRQYEVGGCVLPTDVKFTSKVLRMVKAFSVVPPPPGTTDLVKYLVNDDLNIVLCDQTGNCQSRTFLNLTETIDEVRTAGVGAVLVLTNGRRLLRLYSLHLDSVSIEQLLMEIGSGKMPELADPSTHIADWQTDPEFKDLLVILLSNSVVYVVQRNNQEKRLLFLCHVADRLATSDGCTRFDSVHLFQVSKQYRLAITCPQENVIVEYHLTNSLTLKYSRQYPLHDYQICGCHFSDRAFLYVQVSKSNKLFYLVYDPSDELVNMPSQAIPTDSLCPRVLLGYVEGMLLQLQKGFGIISDTLFAYSGIEFLSKVPANTSQTALTMGVRNDAGENGLVEYRIQVDLSASLIDCSQTLPEVMFDVQSLQNVTIKLAPEHLRGPIQSYQMHSNCTGLLSIDTLNPLEKYECLTQQFGEYGHLITMISLAEGIEVIVSSKYLLCVIRHRVHNKLKRSYRLCSLHEFHRTGSQVRLLMMCEGQRFYLLTVDSSCQLLQRNVSWELSDYVVSQFRAEYPYLTVEVPILLPENRDYYSCIFNETSVGFQNCTSLVHVNGAVAQDNFRSVGFDMNSQYVVILERGIGVFELTQNFTIARPAKIWLSEAELASQLSLFAPFAYIVIADSSLNDWLVFEIATATQSYEVLLEFATRKLTTTFTYNKYVNCFYSRQSKPHRNKQFVVKSCDYRSTDKFAVSNLVPISTTSPVRLLQVFLKKGSQGWPALMMRLPASGDVFFNNGFMIISDPVSLVCYHKITEELAWHISYEPPSKLPDELPHCNGWITLNNNYVSKSFNFTIKFTRDRQDESTAAAAWIFRVLTAGSAAALFVMMRNSKRKRKSAKRPKNRIRAATCRMRNEYDDRIAVPPRFHRPAA